MASEKIKYQNGWYVRKAFVIKVFNVTFWSHIGPHTGVKISAKLYKITNGFIMTGAPCLVFFNVLKTKACLAYIKILHLLLEKQKKPSFRKTFLSISLVHGASSFGAAQGTVRVICSFQEHT